MTRCSTPMPKTSISFRPMCFPGGMLLSERRLPALAAQHGLAWHDRRGFGLDYAETLRRWRERFDAAVAAGRLPTQVRRALRWICGAII